LKYALFPLSNEAVRNSSHDLILVKNENGEYVPTNSGNELIGIDLKRIRYKMSSIKWNTVLPQGINIDLTRNFRGEKILISSLESTYYWDPENRKYYQITDIQKGSSPNSYIVTKETVNRDGSII